MRLIKPKGIIIHSMSEYIQGLKASEFLASMKPALSVHGFVHPDGLLERSVDDRYRADHAGISSHNGLSYLNNHYLGIELLLKGDHDWASFKEASAKKGAYSDEQYWTLAEWCKRMVNKHKIPTENIVAHSEVSGDDVRGVGKGKIDPNDGFDWEFFWVCYTSTII